MNNHNCGMHFIYFPKTRIENEFDGDYIYLRRLRTKENQEGIQNGNQIVRKSKHRKKKYSIPKEEKILVISEEERFYYEQLAKLMLEKKKKNATA